MLNLSFEIILIDTIRTIRNTVLNQTHFERQFWRQIVVDHITTATRWTQYLFVELYHIKDLSCTLLP